MRILFADKFPGEHLDRVRSRGHDCTLDPSLSADTLPAAIADHEALVVRSTRVTGETVGRADALKLIVRAGAGTNTIDKETATERGVCVCNVPGRNAAAVAELTLGLLLAIDRNIPDNVMDLREGQWDKQRYAEARGLAGRAMGIVGMGAIGLAVAERARAFGIELKALRRPGRAAQTVERLAALGVEYLDDLETLAERCDIVTFHVPSTQQTRHLVSRALLERMRPGAVIINTSRGDIVDEEALLEAMNEKGIRAGLDVYANEPEAGRAEFRSALARHPGVYGTHHIGASTTQAQSAVAEGVAAIIEAFGRGEVLNCVNLRACAVAD